MVSVSSVSTSLLSSSSTSSASTDLSSTIAKLKANAEALQKEIDDANSSDELTEDEKEKTVQKAEESLKQIQAQIANLTARLNAQNAQSTTSASNSSDSSTSQSSDDETNPYAPLAKTDLSILNQSNG
ncbi:FlxA-like family protein [Xanthobacter agilis]|jgi:septation ring formation regulator EzrA|uniref:Septation ring formation regulator EzrA n=1 Tax=Xanthobacter agilis TaxID=47492 RepID=A0ABU0LBH2_XANAG|nr:FlxA-like family protein [Xanthobacter agilis]MDQ0504490.1 septation ring formation regulator EzrA [Xanthobacter agilis]